MTPLVEVQPWPGAGGILDGIPEGWHSTGQTALIVGRSKDTLKRWSRDGTYMPSGYMEQGQLTIWLYNEEDIDALRDIVGRKRPGPKRKEKGVRHATSS